MKFDRSKNSRRNIAWSLIFKAVSVVFPFIMRTIIIYNLGIIYLGLGSLFTSILNALNLAELGIGSALVFSMYKPIAEDDKEKVKAILFVYKVTYYIIGGIVLIVGIALVPFLGNFINGEYPTGINIKVIYIIQLLTTAAGYFFMAYKGSLLQAYQRIDVVNKLQIITLLVMYAFQIVGLAVFKSYYIYIIAFLLQIIVFDLIQSRLVDKRFADFKAEGRLNKEDKKEIIVKTGALVGHKVASMIIISADNILISMFMGLEVVALYNNYFCVITALSGAFLMLISGLNSIIGNYLVKESLDNSLKLFNTMHYLVCFVICLCCTCLLVLFQPFMIVWTGEKLLLPFTSVVLFTIYFFVAKVRTVGLLFKDSAGLWERDVLKSWIQIVIDVAIDLWLLQTIGVNGAIISTIISTVFAYFYETQIMFKYCFKAKPLKYYVNTALYAIATAGSCIIAYILCNIFSDIDKWIRLPINLIVATIVSGFVFFISTFWIFEFKDGVVFAKRHILKRGLNFGKL